MSWLAGRLADRRARIGAFPEVHMDACASPDRIEHAPTIDHGG
jgi:hypothetical protein